MKKNIKKKYKPYLLLFSIFLLFLILGTVTYSNNPPKSIFPDAINNNSQAMSGLSSAVLKSMKNCGHYCAKAVIGSVDPSVDNRISDKYNLTIIYDVEERHNNSYEEQDGECNDTYTFDSVNIGGELDITYKDSMGNITKSKIYDISNAGKGMILLNNSFLSNNDTNTTGYESVKIELDGVVRYVYTYKKKHWVGDPKNGSCEEYETGNETHDANFFSGTKKYTVESGKPLFFLVRPVLREQLIQDNRYDIWIFTKRKIENAEVKIDNNNLRNLTIFNLGIVQNESGYGMFHITSTENKSENIATREIKINPYLIQRENKTYRYFYEINNSYDELGRHNLSLTIYDSFGEAYTTKNLITSRKLGFNSTDSDVRQIIKSEIKPIGYSQLSFDNLSKTCGLVGVVFLIIFILRLVRQQ